MSELPHPVAAGSAPALPFPEEQFQKAMATLRTPKRTLGGLILILSLAAFVLLQDDRSPMALAELVGVLLFHELGHYAGMRLFGYADVRMFFVPFFGAAVSGKQRGGAPWKEGVVLLLGPLPGIAAAFGLALAGLTAPTADPAAWRSLAISLVTINAFNLLPLAGLDGAQLLQRVLFSRRRWLQIAFQLLAALGMAAFALDAGSAALGILAFFMVTLLPYRWRLLGKAHELRQAGAVLPVDVRELTDDAGRAVFKAAGELTERKDAKAMNAAMEQLVEAANARPPSIGASFALGFAWFLGLVFALVTLVLVYGKPRPPAAALTPPSLLAPAPTSPDRRPLRLGGENDFRLKPAALDH